MKSSRRNFLTTSTLAAAASFVSGCQTQTKAAKTAQESNPLFKLGLASFTTRNLTLDQTIEIAKRLKLKYISLKEMHMPLNSTHEQIKAAAYKVRQAGLTLYGGGVVYMKTPEQVDQAFEYAKNAGMTTIIGVPNHELLDKVNKKVIEYNIAVAIHNHGPTDKLYPTAESIYNKVSSLDGRIGICLDIGHTQRSGINPSEDIIRFSDRILDVHLKDVSASTAEGSTLEMGRGVIDIPAVFKALIKIGYSGAASFEYEKDANDPLPGLAESVGFARGVLAALQSA